MTRPARTLTTPLGGSWTAPLTVLVLALPALARWWRADLPAGADTAIHLFRAVQLDWAVRHGYWYPRWSPDMVFGFGYPLFAVHGPVAQYVIAAIHVLGLNFIQATLATFALADLLGALGAYAVGRRLGRGALAGMATAAAYVYAPYMLGSLYRGSPAEALALGLLPWLLLAFLQLVEAPTLGRAALAGGLYALLPLLHNPSTVLASLALGAVVLADTLRRGGGLMGIARRLTWPALAVGLGLALSAGYWLPVVFEVGAIQIGRAYSTGVLDFHNNFLSLWELLAAPQPFDPQLIGWSAPRSYGWPALLLALAALGQWRNLTRGQRWALMLAVGGAALAGVLTLPGAAWVWERLPGLSLVQFPVRLLGPGSVALAAAAGLAFANRRPTLRVNATLGAAALACGLFGLAWTFQYGDPLTPPNATLADLHAYEQRSGAIGTTTAGEYLPVGVQQVPPPDTLAARYAAGAPILRLDESSLPAGATISAQSAGIITQSVTLAAPGAFAAVFDVFNYPGWVARVDGAPAPITTTAPYGLIAVPVPAGIHTVEIFFGTTPPRRVGVIISTVGLWALTALIVLRRRGPATADTLTTEWPELGNAAWGVAGVGLVVLAVRMWAGQAETPYAQTRFNNVAVAGLAYPLETLFSDQLELLGYEPARDQVASDGAVDVTLYWRALQPLSVDYSTVLTLQDAEGHVYAQSDSQHPAGFPTSRWRTDQYARDIHSLRLEAGTPPGTYHLVANVYRYPELTALSAGVDIGSLEVTRPSAFGPAGAPQTVAAGLVLESAALQRTTAGVGDDVPLDLYWSALLGPVESAAVQLELIAADGSVAAQRELPLLGVDFDTTRWRAGDQWLGKRSFRVPADLPAGRYTLTARPVPLNGGAPGAAIALGALDITAPERVYDVPVLAHTETVRYADVAELIGWQLADGQLTLAWRALGTADRRYSVFVHVRDVTGAILAQHDAPPGNGARPTTSWLAGEVIVETFALDWPPGALSLAVGLYEPQSGARLRTAHGDDFVVLRP